MSTVVEAITDELPQGELVSTDTRVVVAPATGRFWPGEVEHYTVEGEYVLAGQVIGRIANGPAEEPVVSAFDGWLMGFLVPPGCAVRESDPVVWLRRL